MNEYQVEIHEISSRIITVKAEDEDAAVDMVREAHGNGDHILDYNDFQDVEFNLL